MLSDESLNNIINKITQKKEEKKVVYVFTV
jgi:hypothetical protein